MKRQPENGESLRDQECGAGRDVVVGIPLFTAVCGKIKRFIELSKIL